MEIKKISKAIKTFIEYNEIDEAFDALIKMVKELKYSSFLKALEVLHSRHNDNKLTKIKEGKIPPEEENKIILGLMDILNDTLERAQKSTADLQEKANKESAAQQRIQELEKQIEGLVDAQLTDIVVPENYENEISKEFKFSFCYPKEWAFQRFPQQVQYGAIIDPKSIDENFRTNMNIMIDDISAIDAPLAAIYQHATQQVLMATSDSVLKLSETFLFKGLEASKVRVDYRFNNQWDLTLYQISVADKARKRLFYISFTCLSKKIEENILLFDNIMSTLRI